MGSSGGIPGIGGGGGGGFFPGSPQFDMSVFQPWNMGGLFQQQHSLGMPGEGPMQQQAPQGVMAAMAQPAPAAAARRAAPVRQQQQEPPGRFGRNSR